MDGLTGRLERALSEAVAALEAGATPAARRSALHGPRHWRTVARVGMEIARRTPGTDLEVVVLSAYSHDTQRWHDGHDPEHGRRAARAVRSLAAAGGVLDLGPDRLRLLTQACAKHADGLVSPDPTIGAAWDSDRLNLWRCGVAPSPGLLSTAAARSAEVYDWSRGVHAAGDQGWTVLG